VRERQQRAPPWRLGSEDKEELELERVYRPKRIDERSVVLKKSLDEDVEDGSVIDGRWMDAVRRGRCVALMRF
jgi:hypothetical protein